MEISKSYNLMRIQQISQCGTDFPAMVKKQHIECPRENINLFTTSSYEISKIDPTIAYHQLNIELAA